MKKLLIIIPIVVVVAAAVVLGLFAAGVFGTNPEEPVAQAVEAAKTDLGVFKGLGVDTYFDMRCDRDPSTALDNYVYVADNKGNKVPLKSTRQGDGVYRITARDGFRARASYQIWARAASFVDEKYAGLDTFIFMIAGEEKEVVTVNPALKETKVAGTVVEKTEISGEIFYDITLPEAVAGHYAEGDIILAKKPADDLIAEEYKGLYTGDIPGYSAKVNGVDVDFNGMAAYYVLRTSETKDGKEEVYCRLAAVNEVVTELDINKTLTIDENNFTVNEEMLQEALDKSDFTAAVYEAACEAFDLFSGKFEKTVKDSPKMVASFEYDVSTDKIQLDFYFTITLVKGMDIVFAVKNTIDITPNINAKLNDLTSLDFDLDLGVNLKTKTACTIDMETTDAKLQAKDVEDFKKKFKEIVTGKTAEKGIVGAELPIYSYKYPIYCFVLGIEFGVDINLGLKAQIAFEYDYLTDITVGVTYVNGEIGGYKSIDTSSDTKDFVLLGKLKAEAGVYVKLTASLLEVAGVGFKVKTGAYAEVSGQIRLDMKAAIENKELRVLSGYYVTGGLYLALGFELKAGITVAGKFLGWDKYWEPGRWEFPLFEFGSKYIVDSFVNSDMNVEIQGKNAEFKTVKVNAFDLDKVEDAKNIDIGIDAFDVEYLDDAADYITFENGRVTVNPTVGTEFYAKVKITPKTGSDASATITFHKVAVQPTCAVTALTFDVMNPADVTFPVKKNQSEFVDLVGDGINGNFFIVNSDGEITIYKSFLADLSVGEHVFTYLTDKGRLSLTVNVINSTPITAAKSTYVFKKSGMANANFVLDLSGNKVTEVTGLQKGEYGMSGNILLISGGYLMTKEEGTYDYVVKASNGTSLPISVNVVDDRIPELLTSSYTFGKNTCTADVVVNFVSYNYSLKSVSGNGIKSTDYSVADGKLTIKKNYLSSLSLGEKAFTLEFDKAGEDPVRPEITVTVKESATIIASAPTATYDIAAPAGVAFTVIATSDVTVSGNGIGSNYTIENGTTVKLSASFLKSLKVGEYTFTATAGSASASLYLKVIDTSVPEIETANGGVATIKYDKKALAPKSDKVDSFDILHAGNGSVTLTGNGITADDYIYALDPATGTTKITLTEHYISALRVGRYEYSVVTDSTVSTLVLNVVDTSKPETASTSTTSLSYTLGENADRFVVFNNYEHNLKSITVKGGDAISLYAGDCDFDVASGVFSIRASYLETLPATYVTLFITFDDEASTALSITIAVNA